MTVAASEIIAMGFSAPMFGITDAELSSRITAAISEQSDLIADRVGSAAFALAVNAKAINRAVKLLTASEMARRRIVQLSGNTVIEMAESTERLSLQGNIEDWEKQAEYWIGKVVSGGGTDSGGFASGCSVSYSDSRMTWPTS